LPLVSLHLLFQSPSLEKLTSGLIFSHPSQSNQNSHPLPNLTLRSRSNLILKIRNLCWFVLIIDLNIDYFSQNIEPAWFFKQSSFAKIRPSKSRAARRAGSIPALAPKEL
jgi:hypothetical protein